MYQIIGDKYAYDKKDVVLYLFTIKNVRINTQESINRHFTTVTLKQTLDPPLVELLSQAYCAAPGYRQSQLFLYVYNATEEMQRRHNKTNYSKYTTTATDFSTKYTTTVTKYTRQSLTKYSALQFVSVLRRSERRITMLGGNNIECLVVIPDNWSVQFQLLNQD